MGQSRRTAVVCLAFPGLTTPNWKYSLCKDFSQIQKIKWLLNITVRYWEGRELGSFQFSEVRYCGNINRPPFESCVFAFLTLPDFMLAVVLPARGQAKPLGKPTVWVPTQDVQGCRGSRTENGSRIMLTAPAAPSGSHPYT